MATPLIPPITGPDDWRCWQHDAEGHKWAADTTMAPLVVTITNCGTICCSTHQVPLVSVSLDGQSRYVVVQDLGAASYYDPDGQHRLIIWQDWPEDSRLGNREVDKSLGVVQLRYRGGPRFELRGSVVALHEISCSPASTPGSPRGGFTIPVKRQYLDLIDGQAAWFAGTNEWQVRLRGWPGSVRLACKSTDAPSPESGVVLWPREVPESWRAQVTAVHFSMLDEVSLIERDREKGLLRFGPYQSMPILQTTDAGPVAYLSLRGRGQERGAIQPAAPPASASSGADTIGYVALDFGTSNSLVAYALRDATANSYVMHGTKTPGDESDIIWSQGRFFIGLLDQVRVFSGWFETSDPQYILSSLLVERKGADISVVQREPSLLRNLRPAVDTQIYANLKWQPASEFIGSQVALEGYLERVFLPAFNHLRRKGVRRAVVGATFPLAFDQDRRSNYADRLSNTLKRLGRRTGMIIDGPRLFSESEAGVKSAAGLIARYKLTIDMGGGTTDIAILDTESAQVLAADSLQIGARAIIRVLCGRAGSDAGEERIGRLRSEVFGKDPPDIRDPELLFETLIQSRGVDAVVLAIKQNHELGARQAVAALLAAIVVVCHRLLDITLPRDKTEIPAVGVGLLGQGWHLLNSRLIDGFSEQKFLDTLKSKGTGRYDLTTLNVGNDPKNRKRRIVEGAMLLLREAGEGRETAEGHADYVGMQLNCEGGVILSADQKRVDPSAVTPAQGDPGYGLLIDELMKLLPIVCSGAGDPTTWLGSSDPDVPTKTRKQVLIDNGCMDLRKVIGSDGQLKRSPLCSFLSGPWVERWMGR